MSVLAYFAKRLLPAGIVILQSIGTVAHANDFIWGANGHPLTTYPGIPLAKQIDKLGELGMSSYRVDIGDTSAIPRLAYLVEEARRRNVTILPVLTPDIDLAKEIPAAIHAKAFNFAATLVARFKQDIRVWELGNEAETFAILKGCEIGDDGIQRDCKSGPAGGVGSLDYYGPRWVKVSALLKGLSEGAMSADNTVQKAVGTGGGGHLGAFNRFKQDGIEWDISVWHMYGDDPEWAFKELAKFNKPIWVTEINALHGSRNGEDYQADYLVKGLARLRELSQQYDIRAAYVYELLDQTQRDPGLKAAMGLTIGVKNEQGAWNFGYDKLACSAVKALLKPAAASAQPPP